MAAGIITVATIIDPDLLTAVGVSPAHQVSVLKAVGAIVAVLNVGLRIGTNKGVTLTQSKG